MNKAENDAKQDEEFVFNSRLDEIKNSKKLKGVEYRLGDQGYDIQGKKIDKSYMLPVFVKKNSLKLLDENWKKEMAEIRNWK